MSKLQSRHVGAYHNYDEKRRQAKKQKGCSADVSRSGSSLKTSFE